MQTKFTQYCTVMHSSGIRNLSSITHHHGPYYGPGSLILEQPGSDSWIPELHNSVTSSFFVIQKSMMLAFLTLISSESSTHV